MPQRTWCPAPGGLLLAATASGLAAGEWRGMAYLPAIHRAWWTRSFSVNYIASFGKPGADRTEPGSF